MSAYFTENHTKTIMHITSNQHLWKCCSWNTGLWWYI